MMAKANEPHWSERVCVVCGALARHEVRWRRDDETAIVETECQKCHAIGTAEMPFRIYRLTTKVTSNLDAASEVLDTISQALRDAKVSK